MKLCQCYLKSTVSANLPSFISETYPASEITYQELPLNDLFMPLLHPNWTPITLYYMVCQNTAYRNSNIVQSALNAAARLLTYTSRYDHITPVLAELHWLSVEKRIIFKILLLTYKALHSQAPTIISELLVPNKPVRTLKSSSALLLKQHKYNLKKYGYRQFQVSAPCLWSSLPKNINSASSVNCFKSKLKTYLYEQSYTYISYS